MQLPGVTGLQRACTECVADVPRLAGVKKSLRELGMRLHQMCGVKVHADSAQGLEEIMEFCMQAVNPLQNAFVEKEGKRSTLSSQVKKLDARFDAARESAIYLCDKLCVLQGTRRAFSPTNVEEALEHCLASLPRLEEARRLHCSTVERAEKAEALAAEEGRMRKHLESKQAETMELCIVLGQGPPASAVIIEEIVRRPATEERSQSKEEPSNHEHEQNHASALYDVNVVNAAEWQQDSANCVICNVAFSRLNNKNRRHHCRICGRCVCSACSPSTVQLRAHGSLERACTPCVGNAERAAEMREAAVWIATRLNVLCGLPAPKESQLGSLGEALAFCDSAIAPLEALLGGVDQRANAGDGETSHVQVVEARAEIVRLQRGLEAVKDKHKVLQTWALWAKGSAVSLQSCLDGPPIDVHFSDEREICNGKTIARLEVPNDTSLKAPAGFSSYGTESVGSPFVGSVQTSPDDLSNACDEDARHAQFSPSGSEVDNIDAERTQQGATNPTGSFGSSNPFDGDVGHIEEGPADSEDENIAAAPEPNQSLEPSNPFEPADRR